MGRNLWLWEWPVTTFGVAATILVAGIPVPVAQKRIKALSPGSDTAHGCPRPRGVLGRSLSAGPPHEDVRECLKKTR